MLDKVGGEPNASFAGASWVPRSRMQQCPARRRHVSAHLGSNQSRGQHLVKGALVSRSPSRTTPTFVVFQYNPASLRRSATPQIVGGENHERSESVRITGVPVETITLEIEIDATEELAAADPIAATPGITPQLAALELLSSPTTAQIVHYDQQLSYGGMEIDPIPTPAVNLVWGPNRAIPVRINLWSITDEAFDQQLNPIRATVTIEMRVLTDSDVPPDISADNEFLTQQPSLEAMAREFAQHPSSDGVDPPAI